MIKNVIFDYGNVICKTDIRALIRSFAENEEDFLLMEKAVCENWGDVDAGGDYNAYKMNAASRLPERLRASCVRFFEEWYTLSFYPHALRRRHRGNGRRPERTGVQTLSVVQRARLFLRKHRPLPRVRPLRRVCRFGLRKSGQTGQAYL